MSETKPRHRLKAPPPQTVPGVVLYHEDQTLDDRIRQVAMLIEGGYELDTICQTIERRPTQVKAYMRQIRLARQAYIQAYPEEFQSGLEGLHAAIMGRHDFDGLLRREYHSADHKSNPSNRVGLLKLIMRNMRELEELSGLLVQRFEHSGSVGVKNEMQALLDQAPEEVREEYLDALTTLVAAAEAQSIQSPNAE
jgi:hypothetical protein